MSACEISADSSDFCANLEWYACEWATGCCELDEDWMCMSTGNGCSVPNGELEAALREMVDWEVDH